MRLIDADALIAEYDRVHVGPPGRARELIINAQTVQPEPDHFREASKMIWHECDPNDPSSFPDDGRAVLVSFPDSQYLLLDGLSGTMISTVGRTGSSSGCMRTDGGSCRKSRHWKNKTEGTALYISRRNR